MDGTEPTADRGATLPDFHEPYADSRVNVLYNLLFCDDLALFRKHNTLAGDTPWSVLLSDELNVRALQSIAADESEESRVRALAYYRLRAAGYPVAEKKLLGVIAEVPLDLGLDALAAYADGRVRYLNQSEKIVIVENGGAPEVEALARELVSASQSLVDQIGPWEQKRLPPPAEGNVRLTFLVSDGLYFGEGPFSALRRDPLGGPVLAKAAELLERVVETKLKDSNETRH